jgi:hypothetical protein
MICILQLLLTDQAPNGLRYLRWGGDGEAVQPEKCSGVENCLKMPQNPQRQVHALFGGGLQLFLALYPFEVYMIYTNL